MGWIFEASNRSHYFAVCVLDTCENLTLLFFDERQIDVAVFYFQFFLL